jgi:tellurite resistance-related uncharacterized protein
MDVKRIPSGVKVMVPDQFKERHDTRIEVYKKPPKEKSKSFIGKQSVTKVDAQTDDWGA